MQAGTGKIEEELKALAAAYQEKSQVVQAGKRKKGGSLMTAPLEEVLTEEHVKVRPPSVIRYIFCCCCCCCCCLYNTYSPAVDGWGGRSICVLID